MMEKKALAGASTAAAVVVLTAAALSGCRHGQGSACPLYGMYLRALRAVQSKGHQENEQ